MAMVTMAISGLVTIAFGVYLAFTPGDAEAAPQRQVGTHILCDNCGLRMHSPAAVKV